MTQGQAMAMNPFAIARDTPDRVATVLTASGAAMSYGELAELARRIAAGMRGLGLRRGDHIALLMYNSLMFHPVCWAAWLAGLYFTPISTRLRFDEIKYIIGNCDAKLVIAGSEFEDLLVAMRGELAEPRHWYVTGANTGRLPDIDQLTAGLAGLEIAAGEQVGTDMLYSSGTTGRPKGIVPGTLQTRDDPYPLAALLQRLYGLDRETRYLCPAPLYHSAPLKYSMAIHRFGGINVIMEKFEAEAALAAIERHEVTHSQWVPTMFHRLARLPDRVKQRYNLASHRAAIHAAAPCPVALKQQIIDWWGPIVHEYYAGSEAIGYTAIDTEEWLRRPGSVGRAVLGELHIVGEDGSELPAGEIGQIYFGNSPPIAYHKDPEKTASVYLPNGWITLGDMGQVDDEGYLYLSDRKDFMIITGGVNVYPKEIEDFLVMHPAIEDAAVFGLPNEEFGEEIKAVVQPVAWPADEAAFIAEVMASCREKLSPIKLPKSVDLVTSLPRQENGKLYKKPLRESYLVAAGSS